MAPEQFEGLASAKSDQYSLGCIAYELVTGHRLFTLSNPTLEAYWFHHAKVEPAPPTNFQPQLPKSIEQAILKTLEKDRENRYADIVDFIAALKGTSLHDFETLFELAHSQGVTPEKINLYEKSLVSYGLAIHLRPNFTTAYNWKGTALIRLNRYMEALSTFEQAISFNANDAAIHINKGIALCYLKRYVEALNSFEIALDLQPQNSFVYFNKGNALSNLKRYDKALTAYNQAIQLDPKSAFAYIGKAYTLQILGKSKEAQRAFDIARQPGYND